MGPWGPLESQAPRSVVSVRVVSGQRRVNETAAKISVICAVDGEGEDITF